MSRIGKKIRTLPSGVTADVKGTTLTVKGPKGTLTLEVPARASVAVTAEGITTSVVSPDAVRDRALWGTVSSLVQNMIVGVTEGFSKQLEINGVGYKASLKGTDLMLDVGYTNPVIVKPLAGVSFKVEKNIITVTGADKQAVGEMAAIIRRVRKPEPYKGKGIKYTTETIRRKAGKTATKAAA